MESSRFFNASLDKICTTLLSIPSLDANGTEGQLFKKKLAYPNAKGQSIGSFYKPLKLGGERYFFTLKQSYPKFEEIKRTQTIVVKKNNLKELMMLCLKDYVLLLTDVFQKDIDKCKEAYGNIPIYSYSSPTSTLESRLKIKRSKTV